MLVECPVCIINFDPQVLSEYSSVDPDDPMEAFHYTFSKCPKCATPILVQQERIFENGQINWSYPELLYPNSDFYINPVIPEKLRECLLECIKCYRAKSYTATTIMCRRTIEGFCKLKSIQENNLAKSIEKLKVNGIINEQLFGWANQLRLIGNEAAHNIDIEFTVIDSKDALDFTIAILDFTYSFKDKFDKFQKRLSQVKKE